MTKSWFLAALVNAALAMTVAAADAKKPHVVFVTGDCEYRSEITMPMIAQILEKHHGMKCTVLYAVDDKGEKKPKYLQNIEGLEALKDADLAVFYVRFRQLPDDQLKMILDYVNSGKPVVGLRTSTHAFRYPGGPNARYNDGFGKEVFGQRWISHHGHNSSTKVYLTIDSHPILRGVKNEFHARSWLYLVSPLHGDCQALLHGAAVKGEKPVPEIFGTPHPVAWTKTHKGGRVFFTTLGHPKDFEEESMRRLLVNGIFWALGMENKIPGGGLKVDFIEEYVAPPTTRAVPDPTLPSTPTRFARNDEGNPIGN